MPLAGSNSGWTSSKASTSTPRICFVPSAFVNLARLGNTEASGASPVIEKHVAAHGDKAPGGQLDGALRAALTRLATGEPCAPPAGSALALRYVRDRVNVPRDMPLWSARRLREALEATAQLDGDQQPPALHTRHRRDQDPSPFVQRGGGPAWTVA